MAEKVKTTAKKATETVAAETKKVAEEAKKKAAEKKTAQKPAAKKTEVTRSAVVQFAGEEYRVEEVIAKAEAAYKAENKRKAIRYQGVYKPEDHAAYYVVNNDYAGKIGL